MSDDTTTQLQGWLDRLRAGDDAARAELIRRAGHRLQRLTHKMFRGYRRLRDFEDTDDVLQNALLRLLRALEAAPPASVAGFFQLAAALIRRELIDLARHYYGPQGAGAHRAAVDTPGAGGLAYDAPASTYEPSRLATWTEFHALVETLPEPERAVFDLIWYQGLTQAEAAALLGVSTPTIKRRWLAARLQLGQALKGVEV